ncbi:MAG TPA: HD domain-containing phosphohydrolase [Burkholderiales bacterium]
MRKTVPVSELKLGMYVAELDRPWTDTPFKFQGFVLERAEQIEVLQKLCKVVYVDPDRSEILDKLPDNTLLPMKSAVDLSRTKIAKYPEQAPIEAEYGVAVRKHAASTEALREAVLKPLQSGATLDGKRVTEAVEGVTESVLRNPDAMLLFTQLKEKGDYTQAHAVDSSVYMTVFGRFLEMSRDDIALLGHLGLLQDIGKVRLPTKLLEKRERLTEDEMQQARKHVQYSVEILRATPHLPPGLAELAGLHHERHDGSGYPKKLAGKEIGLIGSVAGIVDTFTALTARRPYAEPLAPSTALSILYKHRGTLLDGFLVEQFIRCLGIFPVGSIVEMNSGETGIVIAQNLAKRLLPRVMVIKDSEGKSLRPQKIVDLSREPKTVKGEAYRIRRTLEYGKVPLPAEAVFA